MSGANVPAPGGDRASLRRAALARLLEREGVAGVPAQTIPRRSAPGDAPATFSQELLWLLDQSTPGLTAYNGPVARRLRGPVDAEALQQALSAMVERHEALRTVFSTAGDGVTQRIEPAQPVRLMRDDLRAFDAGTRQTELASRMSRAARERFDLRHDPLLRAHLYQLDDAESVLLLVSHHIVMDGWSLGILFRELGETYRAARENRPPTLNALPVTYGDFAAWQRETATGPGMEASVGYWRRTLEGPLPTLELPTDRPRPAVQSFDGATARRVIPRPVLDGLKALAQAHGASLYMAAVAAYQALLHRYSGQDDILIGSPVAGRVARETEGVIGYFNNPLVLRTSLAGDPSFAGLLERVRETCLGAYEHQALPFELLVLALQQTQPEVPAPLFRCVLTMQEAQGDELRLPGVEVSLEPVEHGTVKFDLTLLTSEHPDGLHFDLEYRTDLFDAETATRMLGHLETLITGAVADPDTPISRLPLLTREEQGRLAAWNATAASLGAPVTMAGLLEAAASRRGDQPAVVDGSTTVSWDELRHRAGQIARALQDQGVGPDVPVGLCLDRSADLVVAMVGILWSGGAYLPLPPDLPPERLRQQLAASGARVVVTLEAHRPRLPGDVAVLALDTDGATLAGYAPTVPAGAATPEHLAYVLFTSGSTGVPKGVGVTHGNLVHYTRSIARRLGLDLQGSAAPWHCGSVSTLAADLGHTSVFPALASGGTLHVLPGDVVLDGARFQAYVARHPLDLLKITPSHFHALAGPEFAGEHLPARWLVLGGEPCPWTLVHAVLSQGRCRVLNHYGPTETTVGATTFEPAAVEVGRWQPATVPIGSPLANVVADVLDSHRQAVPVGVPGELWLGGAGVARGYLGREDLTAERFVGLGGERRYRTGDRVRRLPTGDLEFLGRLDTQVKVRGHRVELGEIETVLCRHPSVRQAIVTVAGEALVGYLVEQAPVTDVALSAAAALSLPDFMVPTQWVRLDAIPLTANGKVDRAALPAPLLSAPPAADTGDEPRNELEAGLVQLWADVLKRERVGRRDNFFALGGHSLLAIRLLGRIAKAYGVRLSLRTLFEHATIESLAPLLVPRHRLEEPLAAIWAEILKRDAVDREANFFALGGHSLLAIRLLGKVAKTFGVRLSLRTLFEQPTVALLAPAIEAAGGKAAE